MVTGMAVIGDAPLQNLIAQIAQSRGVSCVCYHPSERPGDELTKAQMIVLILLSKNSGNILESLRALRLDVGFRGIVVVLSFIPLGWIAKQQGGEALRTPGCFYLPLPFLVEEFIQLATRRVELSDAEMSQVRRKLGARQVDQEASKIRHDYDGKFSMVLAHLREIEKLSYFSNPDLRRVEREIHGITIHLTREKIEGFQTDVGKLLEAAAKWRGNEKSHDLISLDGHWAVLDDWFELNETLGSDIEPSLSELFKRAQQTQTAIRAILAAVTSLKEEAQKEISYAK
jgi:hypothetical protein